MKDVATIGVDLAKNVIQVHGVDQRGKAVLKKQLPRRRFVEFFANLPACLGRHGGLQRRSPLGTGAGAARSPGEIDGPAVRQTVRQDQQERRRRCRGDLRGSEPAHHALRASQKRRAASGASHASGTRRLREGAHGQANQIRGLLGEYGIVIPQGICHITRRLPMILEDGENALPGIFRQLLVRLGEHLKDLDRQVGELEAQIQAWHREDAASSKLAQIPGIGPLNRSRSPSEKDGVGRSLHIASRGPRGGTGAKPRNRERCFRLDGPFVRVDRFPSVSGHRAQHRECQLWVDGRLWRQHMLRSSGLRRPRWRLPLVSANYARVFATIHMPFPLAEAVFARRIQQVHTDIVARQVEGW